MAFHGFFTVEKAMSLEACLPPAASASSASMWEAKTALKVVNFEAFRLFGLVFEAGDHEGHDFYISRGRLRDHLDLESKKI